MPFLLPNQQRQSTEGSQSPTNSVKKHQALNINRIVSDCSAKLGLKFMGPKILKSNLSGSSVLNTVGSAAGRASGL